MVRPGVCALMVSAATLLVAACAEAPVTTESAAPVTIGGVGELPEALSAELVTVIPSVTAFPRPDEPDPDLYPELFDLIGERVDGPRLLVIGDSIIASASRRYGGEICDTLVPLGWQVEVNAEVGRFIEFGNQVVRERLDPANGLDWDAVVVSLGSNFGGNLDGYRVQLERLLDRVAPRPVVLFNVTEFRADRVDLNELITEVVAGYPEVTVVDWAAITREDRDLLRVDRLHLSDSGRQRLAEEMGLVLGSAPGSSPGRCLETEFEDDSLIDDAGPAAVPSTTGPAGSSTGSSTTAPGSSGSSPETPDQGDPNQTGPDQAVSVPPGPGESGDDTIGDGTIGDGAIGDGTIGDGTIDDGTIDD